MKSDYLDLLEKEIIVKFKELQDAKLV